MQWYAAFGLMLSLIWIYVYVLRLLAQLRSRIEVNRVPRAQRPQGKERPTEIRDKNRDKGYESESAGDKREGEKLWRI